MSYGFVYILGNPVFPGIFKVGMTERSPSLRCKELSSSTSAPDSFVLLSYYEFEDARYAEQAIHSEFQEFRVNRGREFFDVCLYVLHEALLAMGPLSHYESYLVELSGKGHIPFVSGGHRLAGVLVD